MTTDALSTGHSAEQWAECIAFQQGIELLGRRWTGVILYTLLKGPRRFNELLNSVYGISDRLLTERLRELEDKGLVQRSVIPESPIRVEYALTDAGKDAEEIITIMFRWSNKWFHVDPVSTDAPTDCQKGGDKK
jgi:DNA-binding HxlR family transcriptional regulator